MALQYTGPPANVSKGSGPFTPYKRKSSKGVLGTQHVYAGGRRSVFVPARTPAKGLSGPAKGIPFSSPALGAPAAQGAPASLPLPVDPQYDQDIGRLGQNRDTQLGALGAQRVQGLLDYGYNEANGSLTFDPQNPYSQAALLKQNYDRQRKGAGTSMAARGQLYAGSYQNAQNDLYSRQGQSEDALMKALQRFLTKNTGDVAQANTDYESGAGVASGDRLGRLPQNPLYEPGAEPGEAPAAPAGAKEPFQRIPGKSKSGVKGYWHVYKSGRKVFVKA